MNSNENILKTENRKFYYERNVYDILDNYCL